MNKGTFQQLHLQQQQQQQSQNMASVDPATAQINKYCTYVTMLAEPNCKDDLKLKAIQEISENCEVIKIKSFELFQSSSSFIFFLLDSSFWLHRTTRTFWIIR